MHWKTCNRTFDFGTYNLRMHVFFTLALTLSLSKYLSFSLCPHEPGLLSSTSKSSLFFSLHAAWFHQHLYIITYVLLLKFFLQLHLHQDLILSMDFLREHSLQNLMLFNVALYEFPMCLLFAGFTCTKFGSTDPSFL